MSEENIEQLSRVYEEWAKGHLEAGAELYAPDALFEPLAEGRMRLDRDGFQKFMRDFLAQWDGFAAEAKSYRDLGDIVLVTERQRAIGRSSRMEIEMTAYATWKFRDGMVVGVRWDTELASAEEAAGIAG
jgi:ketosteroid isomerase-like protein